MTQSWESGRMDGGEGPAAWRLTEEIDLWLLRAVEPGALWDLCLATISEQERARAMRMRPGTAQNEFVTGRAALRGLLGAALEMPPQVLAITTGRQGKPVVEGAALNVAHARGLIGIALSAQGELGLDLEHVSAGQGWREIADAHFTAAEQDAIAGAAEPERRFCEIWTHKEAAVKATGTGLSAGLSDSDVSGVPATGYGKVVVGGQAVFLQRIDLQDVGHARDWCCSVGRLDAPRAVQMRVLEPAALAGLLR